MPRRILIFDTSILCCLLKIPGKDTAGPHDDRWDYNRVAALIATESKSGATFVLPLASIIETGNHISQAPGDRYELAQGLASFMVDAAEANTPWAAFTHQTGLWDDERLRNLAKNWPTQAVQKISIGDATIIHVAEYYVEAGFTVEILTGDAGLKAYQPTTPAQIPRRRQ